MKFTSGLACHVHQWHAVRVRLGVSLVSAKSRVRERHTCICTLQTCVGASCLASRHRQYCTVAVAASKVSATSVDAVHHVKSLEISCLANLLAGVNCLQVCDIIVPQVCSGASWLVPAAWAAPFAFRFCQCIRVWADTGATPQVIMNHNISADLGPQSAVAVRPQPYGARPGSTAVA